VFVVVVLSLVLSGSLKEDAARARSRFLEGDFAGAVAAADKVDAAFRGGAAWRVDDAGWAAWADSRVSRALALRRLGNEAEAEDQLRALAVVRPTWGLDKSFVPPKVAARFEELREELLAGPTETLTVTIRGKGTLVLDGRVVDPGVLDVLPGRHFLGLDGKGSVVDVLAPVSTTLGNGSLDGDGKVDGTVDGKVDGKVDDKLEDKLGKDPGGAEDGPPWLLIGVGVAAAVVVAGVVTGVVVVASQPQVPNPGGTTLRVDASRLDALTAALSAAPTPLGGPAGRP